MARKKAKEYVPTAFVVVDERGCAYDARGEVSAMNVAKKLAQDHWRKETYGIYKLVKVVKRQPAPIEVTAVEE